MRGVLNALVADGLLFRVPGKGTFVSERKIDTLSPAYRGVREQLEAQGIATTTRLVSLEAVTPRPHIARTLHLPAGDEVFAIERVRSAQGVPVSVHRSWVPIRLAPGLDRFDLVEEQLCVVLGEHYDLHMAHVDEELESTTLSGGDAEQLQARKGLPGIRLEDTISDARGVVFEYSAIVLRGDKIRLRFSFDA